jgi:hypothetical protein
MVGLGALGLQYILDNGGSGYFSWRVVEPLVAAGTLHMLDDAPRVQRLAYVVYTNNPKDEEILQLALQELRTIAEQQ